MCNAEQLAIMGIALIESFQVRFLVGYSFYPEDNAKSFAGEGNVSQQPVRVIFQQLYEAHGLGFGQAIEIHHRVLGNGGDAIVTAVLFENGGRGEGRASGALDCVGILFESLRLEIAELSGVFLQVGIGSDQAVHFFQCDESWRQFGLQRLEQ